MHKNLSPRFNSDYVDGGKKRRDVKDHSRGAGEEVVSPDSDPSSVLLWHRGLMQEEGGVGDISLKGNSTRAELMRLSLLLFQFIYQPVFPPH